ncbi:HDOD domain-containing protein [Steroidobacter sp.]|uniref:HDOD domain-containing protein n=1 Tax=Steroidobacter sp. TaxID=1978227 RepID=UPI001A4C50E2|nr:HDOD domain-containing protein [Steroidobacter sp.]MBL8270746.1 HDOD domain-containing protein [Steroidobacter sp.]
MNKGGIDDVEFEVARIQSAANALGMVGGAPDTAHRLLVTLCDRGVGLKQIIELIARDPGLTARVLKVANSAFYGRPRHVDTLERAIAILGLDAVRGIAAAACLDRSLPTGPAAPLADMTQFARHSVATALAAEQLARLRHPELASEAFIAGLLHELGAVVQAKVDPDGFRKLVDSLHADPSQDVIEVEKRCVSVSQERCVSVVFKLWLLPEALTHSVCHHHRPNQVSAAYRPLTDLVFLGNHASLVAGAVFSAEPAPVGSPTESLGVVGVSEEDLQVVVDGLPARTNAFLE